MRLIRTNWLHPTGFLPADLMHKFGQGVSAPGMLAAYRADLAETVCRIGEVGLIKPENLEKKTTT